jgi:hypothetical protein
MPVNNFTITTIYTSETKIYEIRIEDLSPFCYGAVWIFT